MILVVLYLSLSNLFWFFTDLREILMKQMHGCSHSLRPVLLRCWALFFESFPRSSLLNGVLISEQVDSSIRGLNLLSLLLVEVYLTDGSSLSGVQVHNSFSLYWPPLGQNWCAGGRWFAGDVFHIPSDFLNSCFQDCPTTFSHCEVYSCLKTFFMPWRQSELCWRWYCKVVAWLFCSALCYVFFSTWI